MMRCRIPIITMLLLTSFGWSAAFSKDSKPGGKPNVILILADDLGWKDVAFMGSRFYNTPNLDRLAKQSMQFTNAYTAAANCAPSRACLISGENTPRHGIYTVGTSERGDKRSRKIIPVKNNEILPDEILTLPEALKKAGYQTVSIGKWHLGEDPKSQGFDINIAGTHQGHPPSYFSPYQNAALKDGKPGEYLTDRLTTEALTFLDNREKKPFFLYLPYFAVHTPLQAPEQLKEKYKNRKVKGQENDTYAAMIESLDTNLGRIFSRLDELGLSENTIVIFSSDNGGIRRISDQAPLRAGKGSYYEGGIRVPLLVRWPGKIKAGSESDVPVTNLDFYPTILDMLSIKRPDKIFDGTSIWPLLKGRKIDERPLYWHFPIYLQAYDPATDEGRDPVFRTRPGAAIRMGEWKLHKYYEDGALELYNLKNDLGERNNLVSRYPDIAEKLHTALLEWQKKVKAPVPAKSNPDFKPEMQFNAKKIKAGND